MEWVETVSQEEIVEKKECKKMKYKEKNVYQSEVCMSVYIVESPSDLALI